MSNAMISLRAKLNVTGQVYELPGESPSRVLEQARSFLANHPQCDAVQILMDGRELTHIDREPLETPELTLS